jgi:hypothetical protein
MENGICPVCCLDLYEDLLDISIGSGTKEDFIFTCPNCETTLIIIVDSIPLFIPTVKEK